MQVSEVMSKASAVESPAETLRAAAARMWKQQTGSLLVMDGVRLLGIVTERDVMKAAARGADLDRTPVSAVMTTSVLTVTPQTPVPEAARHMATRWIRHLPVVADEGLVVGVVSQRDLCGVLAALGSDADLVEIPADELVRARRLARLAPGSAEPMLATQSRDDTDVGWGERPPEDDDLRRFLDERPPHHL